jgi:hypothetical protein
VAAVLVVAVILKSLLLIGPAQVGLVNKRFGKRLPGGNVIAMNGEAGYQAELLMPGLWF